MTRIKRSNQASLSLGVTVVALTMAVRTGTSEQISTIPSITLDGQAEDRLVVILEPVRATGHGLAPSAQ